MQTFLGLNRQIFISFQTIRDIVWNFSEIRILLLFNEKKYICISL